MFQIQGFKASRLQGFKASRLQGFKASRLQGFKASRLWRYLVFKKHSSYFSDSRGFSIVGALVASVLGVIVTVGFSKMLVNLSGEVTELKKDANQIGLANKMSGLLSDCQPVLSRSIDANDLQRGEREIIFSELKDKSGSKVLDAVGDKEKRMYGLEGHTSFKLSCLDTDCDCSSSQPCSKNWVLSLFTMSYKNNLPMYKEVLNQGLRITYKTSDVADFTCNFGTKIPVAPAPPAPTCTGGATWDGNRCVCPGKQLYGGNEGWGCYCRGPLNEKFFNGRCVCTGGTVWHSGNTLRRGDMISDKCYCPADKEIQFNNRRDSEGKLVENPYHCVCIRDTNGLPISSGCVDSNYSDISDSIPSNR